jgi:ABC-type transporter Mla MlaB component
MTSTDATHIDCGVVLDISSIAGLHTQCQQALEAKQNVLLKGDDLERTDTAALQVLAAFFQDAKAQQQTVEWQSPSAALYESAGLLGLTDLLQLKTSGD